MSVKPWEADQGGVIPDKAPERTRSSMTKFEMFKAVMFGPSERTGGTSSGLFILSSQDKLTKETSGAVRFGHFVLGVLKLGAAAGLAKLLLPALAVTAGLALAGATLAAIVACVAAVVCGIYVGSKGDNAFGGLLAGATATAAGWVAFAAAPMIPSLLLAKSAYHDFKLAATGKA